MNAAEVSRFLDGVKSFRLDQLSQYLTGRLIAPSSATWRVDVVHKYRHPLALRRAERVAHSLHHEAFHSSLKHEQKKTQNVQYNNTNETRMHEYCKSAKAKGGAEN